MATFVTNQSQLRLMDRVTVFVTLRDKVSYEAHEHASVWFASQNRLFVLTRESIRSTGARWVQCGTWTQQNGLICVSFCDRRQSWVLLAYGLSQIGLMVNGFEPRDFVPYGGRETQVVRCERNGRGWTTNPDSLMGCGRGARSDNAQHRLAKGLDVSTMRKRLMAQRVKRATVARTTP